MLTEEQAAASTVATTERRRRGAASARYRDVSILVAGTDVVAFAAALGVAWFIAAWLVDERIIFGHGSVVAFLIAVPIAQLIVFAAFRLYSLSRLSPGDEFRRLLGAVSVSILSLVVVAFWFDVRLFRFWLGVAWVIALILETLCRRAWHQWIKRSRVRGDLAYRTLIVGDGPESFALIDTLRARYHGFDVVGAVQTSASLPTSEGIPNYGSVDNLERAVSAAEAECVFIASSSLSSAKMAQIMRVARLNGLEVRVAANISNIASNRLGVQPIGTSMALALRPLRLTRVQALAKRTIDVLGALVALLLGLPFFIALAIGIRATSKGPVFYRQERIGLQGKRFWMFKFRTMVVDADTMVDQLQHLNVAQGAFNKLKDDPRVTRIGRFLRRSGLDETPQLINVLKGEMSLVGPRPPLPREVDQYEDWQFARLDVLPGITGLWQVMRQGQWHFDDYMRLDLYYIENWSIPYDLFIILKTIPRLLFREAEC
jgi:exopolysaccharide biosynthesis polyprenyl glycosylphosphotransferase